MSKPELKIIEGGNPYLSESLLDFLNDAREGKIRGLCIVALQGDQIYTDWVKSDGTSVCELLGSVEVLRQELVEAMRGAVE